MAAHAEVDESLRHIRAITRRLRDDLAGLPPAAWDVPTNCPPWTVRDLVAHVVNGAESFRLNVERGVAGLPEPGQTEEERARRVQQLAAASPTELRAALVGATDDLEALYERLTADQLEAICYHRRGNRPARWYIQHRLAEVAFHHWDLRRSLGRPAALDPEVAAFLLPTLVESNLPRIYPHGPRGEGRFRLVVAGEPAASWLLIASPERLEVRPGGDDADATITAPPEVLALLVYGRSDLAEEERHGRARVDGDHALAARFHAIFPKP
jgi:uncharacterized protein (TIGR03083 family)